MAGRSRSASFSSNRFARVPTIHDGESWVASPARGGPRCAAAPQGERRQGSGEAGADNGDVGFEVTSGSYQLIETSEQAFDRDFQPR